MGRFVLLCLAFVLIVCVAGSPEYRSANSYKNDRQYHRRDSNHRDRDSRGHSRNDVDGKKNHWRSDNRNSRKTGDECNCEESDNRWNNNDRHSSRQDHEHDDDQDDNEKEIQWPRRGGGKHEDPDSGKHSERSSHTRKTRKTHKKAYEPSGKTENRDRNEDDRESAERHRYSGRWDSENDRCNCDDDRNENDRRERNGRPDSRHDGRRPEQSKGDAYDNSRRDGHRNNERREDHRNGYQRWDSNHESHDRDNRRPYSGRHHDSQKKNGGWKDSQRRSRSN